MKAFKLLLKILFVAAIAVIITLIYSYYKLNAKISSSNEVFIKIPEKTTIEQTVQILNSDSILTPEWFFISFVKFYSKIYDKKIISGCYKFAPETTNLQIIRSIFSGTNQFTTKVTYPEGITLTQFASISSKKLGIDSAEFIHLAYSDSFLKPLGINTKSAEGYLLANTFEFYCDMSVTEVLKKLIDSQNKTWIERFAVKAKSSKLSKKEILTLASIIEAESPLASERPRIAGVYYNRLKKGLKLEADPTVQYIIGHKTRLLYKDLKIDSPYNTYMYTGLPPTPINSPSISSIEAVINPEEHNYLFFVAVGDGSGRHNFSATFANHKKKVVQFRKRVN